MMGGALLVSARPLLSDSVLVSSSPRISEFDLQSLQGRYTPVRDFFVRDHHGIPPASSLQSIAISGQVERPAAITLHQLGGLKVKTLGAVLECARNGTGPLALMSNGLWEGWALTDILSLVHPAAGARYLILEGADGFRRSVPIQQVSPQALLATRLNRQPLTPEHGAPWRVLLPGLYGMQSVKWLKSIKVSVSPLPLATDEYAESIKGANGQVQHKALPPVLVKSVLTYPVLGQVLHPGTVTLRGLAWGGQQKVAVVEISADGEKTWRVAKLESASRYEWTKWHYTVTINGTGVAEFAVKAIGEKGSEQPAGRNPNRLDPYANNTIERAQFLVQPSPRL